MSEESVRNLIPTPDLEAIVAHLRKRAEREKIKLPADVALYIAQNFRSNAKALEGVLLRLVAHSSLTGTAITLANTQQVLKNFIEAEGRKVTADPFQGLLAQQLAKEFKVRPENATTAEAKVRPQRSPVADHSFIFCLLKAGDGRKTSRVRHILEVNMRESEREWLARRDAYERELERRARKRRQG